MFPQLQSGDERPELLAMDRLVDREKTTGGPQESQVDLHPVLDQVLRPVDLALETDAIAMLLRDQQVDGGKAGEQETEGQHLPGDRSASGSRVWRIGIHRKKPAVGTG